MSGAFMANTDVYATLATIAGGTVGEGQAIDSVDMSGVFLAGEKSPRSRHIFYHDRPMAYRHGDYKAHFYTRERTRDPWTGEREPSVPREPPLLFNVRDDIAESRDIASEHPELVERLREEFEEAANALEEWGPLQT